MVGTGWQMTVKFGSALAVLRAAQIENGRPVALIDVDPARLVVLGERNAEAAMRKILGPWRAHRLVHQPGDQLVKPGDIHLLDRVQARIAPLDGVIEAERTIPQ